MVLKYLLNLILLAVCIFLGYQLFKTIEEPVTFFKQKEVRDEAMTEKLQLLRKVQFAYKSSAGDYADSFGRMDSFIRKGNYMIETKIGDPNDSTVVARIDTNYIPVLDSLFKGNLSKVDSIAYIPYGAGKKFGIKSGTITKNDIEIPAFEISAPYKDLYNGMVSKYYGTLYNQNVTLGSLDDGTTNINLK